ncbi:MAG: MoxR family ATPase [Rhodospirillaceae bacterium]|nr:MoxR family ATPase [Rhodospirillaceae bacterium]
MTALPSSIDAAADLLRAHGYVCERSLATAVFLALTLKRPLFLEGEAGVGKTEIAKVLAAGLGRDLIRLQCYEGLDTASAVYEWNYPRQMMAIRLAEAAGQADRNALARINIGALTRDIYSAEYLIARPLLRALEPHDNGPPVLLIDEVDRTDEPFEAFLLEVLSDYQITIPEWGTIRAEHPPIVIVTSNRTREVHDALKRRCLYHWVDYPNAERERAILAAKHPGMARALSDQVVAFVQSLRGLELFKPPGIAETLDWAQALTALNAQELDQANVDATLGVLLKYQDDIAGVRGETAARLLAQPQAAQ